jgi:hypothetical protein
MGSFSLVQWVIVAVIVFAIVKIARPSKGSAMHCMTCGSDAPSVVRTKGSIAIEIVLWLCFIIPGVIYSIWRMTTRASVCGVCGAENVVPMNTPAAINHRQALQGTTPAAR